jgi:hypothetical protein
MHGNELEVQEEPDHLFHMLDLLMGDANTVAVETEDHVTESIDSGAGLKDDGDEEDIIDDLDDTFFVQNPPDTLLIPKQEEKEEAPKAPPSPVKPKAKQPSSGTRRKRGVMIPKKTTPEPDAGGSTLEE